MPEIPEGAHIVQALSELGWCGSSEFGFVVLSWTEIKAYADATGAIQEPWEFRCIRSMSQGYVTERSDNNPLRIAPYERKENG